MTTTRRSTSCTARFLRFRRTLLSGFDGSASNSIAYTSTLNTTARRRRYVCVAAGFLSSIRPSASISSCIRAISSSFATGSDAFSIYATAAVISAGRSRSRRGGGSRYERSARRNTSGAGRPP
ncbi:hypothetical protein GA0115240_110714 [Streptomyces sp. DvalAA-14]|nr:hypothetical protein GA0115240_110714 [Streptomyces sp. DvalAA-14]